MADTQPNDIEITSEMVAAGEEEILAAYGGLDLNPWPEVVAARVYLAMRQLVRATDRS